MKREVHHIIFDLGGVLLNIDLGRISKGFDKIFVSDEAARMRFNTQTLPDFETGKISTRQFMDSLKPYLKPGYDESDIIDTWNSIILDMPKDRLIMLGKLRR